MSALEDYLNGNDINKNTRIVDINVALSVSLELLFELNGWDKFQNWKLPEDTRSGAVSLERELAQMDQMLIEESIPSLLQMIAMTQEQYLTGFEAKELTLEGFIKRLEAMSPLELLQNISFPGFINQSGVVT